MGVRRRAREAALTVLFETEFQKTENSTFADRVESDDPQKEELRLFLENLLQTYRQNQNIINQEIETHSNNWKLTRMSLVDRNILRLGVTELLFMADIPKNVTINEYLEIAKKYGTEDSSSFINGILDKVEKSTSP